jgi:hypothetical protein
VTSIAERRAARLREFEAKCEVTESEWVRIAMNVKFLSSAGKRVLRFEKRKP